MNKEIKNILLSVIIYWTFAVSSLLITKNININKSLFSLEGQQYCSECGEKSVYFLSKLGKKNTEHFTELYNRDVPFEEISQEKIINAYPDIVDLINIDFNTINPNSPYYSTYFMNSESENQDYILARTYVDYSKLSQADDQNQRIKYQYNHENPIPSCVLQTKIPHYSFGTRDMLIITGSSSNHFKPNMNLLYLIIKYRIDIPLVFIDFGITSSQQKELFSFFHLLHLIRLKHHILLPSYYRKVDYDRLIPWLSHPKREVIMAIKAVIQVDIWEECQGKGFWLDASDEVNSTFFDIVDDLNQYGFVSPLSYGSIKQYTHKGMIEWFGFNYTDFIYTRNPCSSGITGINYKNHTVWENVALKWRECSYDENCHSPIGSDFSNHRQDQASLTWLVHYYNITNACGRYSLFPYWIGIHIDDYSRIWTQNELYVQHQQVIKKYLKEVL